MGPCPWFWHKKTTASLANTPTWQQSCCGAEEHVRPQAKPPRRTRTTHHVVLFLPRKKTKQSQGRGRGRRARKGEGKGRTAEGSMTPSPCVHCPCTKEESMDPSEKQACATCAVSMCVPSPRTNTATLAHAYYCT